MQFKIASGSAGSGFGIVGTGLAWAIPEQRWIGLLLAAIGVLVFLFDVRFERGEIESGERRLGWLFHAKRLSRRKMIALIGMLICGVGFLIFTSIYFLSSSTLTRRTAPDILLVSPVYEYSLVWNADTNVEIIMLPNRGPTETAPLKTGLPLFRIKNIGKAVATQLQIEWEAQHIDLNKTVDTSARLNGYDVRLSETQFAVFRGMPDDRMLNQAKKIEVRGVISGQSAQGYACGYAEKATSSLPYLAPVIDNTTYLEIPLPYQIANLVGVYIVAAMPYQPPAGWQKFLSIIATIKWIGEGPEQQFRYRIDVEALDIGGWATVGGIPQLSPGIKAEVRFIASPADLPN